MGITEALRELVLHAEMQCVGRAAGRVMKVGAEAKEKIIGCLDPLAIRLAKPISANEMRSRERALFEKCHPKKILVITQAATATFQIRLLDVNAVAKLRVPRRIVLIRPSDRHELPALKTAGFTGYLIKPVRAASLAARLRADDDFEHTAVEPAESDATPTDTKDKGLSILIAEDNEINALLARSLLVRLGHTPTIAGNGEAAVESWTAARAAGAPYDLILMDVQMPVMDGLEATRRIRAGEADTPPTPIVALTANAYAEDREACLAAGMDALLVKPLDRERLREALEAAARRAPLAA